MHPESISQLFTRQLARIDLPTIRFHDLRHTHASLLAASSTPIKVVSERLGHAHPGFTMATYQHVMPGMGASAAHTFAQMLTTQRDITEGSRQHASDRQPVDVYRFGSANAQVAGSSPRQPVDDPVETGQPPGTTEGPETQCFRAFQLVAGAGFEPATFGL